jgi:hypothetical protein
MDVSFAGRESAAVGDRVIQSLTMRGGWAELHDEREYDYDEKTEAHHGATQCGHR